MNSDCTIQARIKDCVAALDRLCILALLLVICALTGCSTPHSGQNNAAPASENPDQFVLRAGDVLRITFPGAPNLNVAPQPIRRDGKITLPLVGEVVAANKTPAGLESELVNLYSGQLVVKAVNVNVESSSFTVYVTGSVLRPGRVDSNKPLTALQAVMEAGGFDYNRANMSDVKVTRTSGRNNEHFSLNLRQVLEGKEARPFYLKPGDILYVPERFNWF
ncbi:MAG TPA: polysaccharide biosynthesis/export family protein [Verrucomicrobiae bacterium]|nr:polysaccharide biosynthesis/export family protein [Verrucomicrobiae bacterium]